MIFTLQVFSAPYSNDHSNSAYKFASELLRQKHQIYQIFFYGDGVYNADTRIQPPADSADVVRRWSELATQHKLDFVACSASAATAGIEEHLAPGFQISGMAQLVDATIHSDRVISFGP